MQPIRLFGTLTSPYVRRVRIVADLLGLDVDFVDATTDAGQAALRAQSPIWKIPVIQVGDATLFDSRVITQWLMTHHPSPALHPTTLRDTEAANVITVADGALDALIACFYLAKDGITSTQSSYLAKHQQRAAASMAWLEQRVHEDRWMTASRHLGLPEIAVATALAWMRFRDTYSVDQHPALQRLLNHYEAQPAFVATRPPS